jgi:hypothetical protein
MLPIARALDQRKREAEPAASFVHQRASELT